MTGRMRAREFAVSEIFSDAFRLDIPGYQRPYAWRKEQAAAMLRDLQQAALGGDGDPAPYFLGSIVVVKQDGRADTEVVDGQQRLASLLILLSLLREQAAPPVATRVDRLMFGADGQARFRLRDTDRAFFETHIQRAGRYSALRRVALHTLPESQRRIAENARLFRASLTGVPAADCDRLVTFIADSTFLVVVSTPEFDSAYRTFTILNERGLDLAHSDILKAEVVGRVPASDRSAYGSIWEAQEDRLGRHDFGRLFSYIRTTQVKRQLGPSIVEDVRSLVLPRFPDPRVFMDDVLVPMADAFIQLEQGWHDGSGSETEHIARWLHATGSHDWMPPALAYQVRFGADPTATARFLADLERLSATMLIRNFDPPQRLDRYGRVLEEIEASADLYAPRSALQLSKEERAGTLRRLSGDLSLGSRGMRLFLLHRLDALLDGGQGGPRPHATVEHMLPQSPRTNSHWRKAFSNAERAEWVHRLGNLALLTKKSNVTVANWEYGAKRAHYAALPESARFALTTAAFTPTEWTPSVVRQRHLALVGQLSRLWRLK